MPSSSTESQRLETALRWLESHHRRLSIRQKSLEHQLADLGAEIDRVSKEIEIASERLRQSKKT
jgi:predicted  nucleic acid-binding Zn-ribbon protein